MRLLVQIAAFAIVLVIAGDATAGEEPLPVGDLSRTELEQRLATILKHGTYGRLTTTAEEGAPFETTDRWGDDPASGGWSQSSQTTARFDGCLVTVHLEKPGYCERGMGDVDSVDRVVDLRFIEGAASTRPPRPDAPDSGAIIDYPFRPQIADELLDLSIRASEITEESHERFPSDLPARLEWLAERFKAEITGEALAGAHQQIHRCPGGAPSILEPPLIYFEATFRVDPERAGEFVTLMDEYRERYCRVSGDAAIQRIDFRK